MGILEAKITQIEECESLHIVKFDFRGESLTMMSLELPGRVHAGAEVKLSVKPTHITLGKGIEGRLSLSNRLKVKVSKIEVGKLLASIVLDVAQGTYLESIITKESLESMNIQENDEVEMFIKASELAITEVTK